MSVANFFSRNYIFLTSFRHVLNQKHVTYFRAKAATIFLFYHLHWSEIFKSFNPYIVHEFTLIAIWK